MVRRVTRCSRSRIGTDVPSLRWLTHLLRGTPRSELRAICLAVEEPGTGRPSGEVCGPSPATGLFDFGDRDGEGDTVRLQHAQGIAIHPNGKLLVADFPYNDAVKWVDPIARTSATFLKGFREPGGLAYHAGRELLYVWPHTNAHRIAVVDERTGDVSSPRDQPAAPNA